MSLTVRWLAIPCIVAQLHGGTALAQQDEDRFFATSEEGGASLEATHIDGSLTSTTFFFREVGGIGTAVVGGGAQPDNASPVDRLFTDLRILLDARHISGGKWHAHTDLRARLQPNLCKARRNSSGGTFDCPPAQSGTFGGTELDARQLYVERRGANTDVVIGRQVVAELAAVRFDGIRIERGKSSKWRYIAFAGLYPARVSRNIGDDYPAGVDAMGQPAGRVMPVTGGAGAAYRLEKAYGALGLVGILPLADDIQTDTLETQRIFATANGYWRQSSKTDIYHYLVIDGTGAAGARLTNASVGANHRPRPNFRLSVQGDRVDTETLNAHAQLHLEEPDPDGGAYVQNNLVVTRFSQEAVKAGASAALADNRFEISAFGALRRRPQIRFVLGNGSDVVFPRSQSADVTLQVLDRRSIKQLRLGGTVTRAFGVGSRSFDRASSLLVRVNAAREMFEGKGEVDTSISYVDSTDDDRGLTCDGAVTNPLDCFGTAKSRTISLGGTVFYRPKDRWFVIGALNLGAQKLSAVDASGSVQGQPNILMASAFVRAAYRF